MGLNYKMTRGGRLVPIQNKYGNKKVDGFDSQGELERYRELQLLEKAHKLRGLQHHVRWNLKVHDVLVCWYEADFQYLIGDIVVVEDYKSVHTRKLAPYRIKKKLFHALYPDVVFYEYVKGGKR